MAGKGSGSVWNSPVGPVKKVSRTRKKLKNESDTVINIGVLRDPKDIIADIDLEGQPQEIVSKVKDFKSKYAKEIRSLAGLDSTPQLIVYVIDKDSKAVKGSDTREDLNSVEDIVGICMNIPGGKRGTDYTATVSIHMQIIRLTTKVTWREQMKIEIAEPGRMTQSGSSLLKLIQNNNMPILDLLVRESIQNSLDAKMIQTHM